VGASFAASRLAEREAVNDAAHTTNLLALAVVQPVLQDALLTGDAAAYDALDRVVRERVLPNGIVRVKLWAPDGRIVYADETRLVGQRFTLGDDQRATLAQPQTRAEVSDLNRSENEFERYGGKLLEVYRPVWTPSGAELLFEVYGDYEPVSARAFDLWRGLAGVLASSLLLLLVLMAPIIWRLLDRLGAAQAQRESVLRASVEASARERRRIAADLHDGPVQDLVASSLAVSVAAASARSDERTGLAATITEAASTVRASVASLRSLLVDIYPERLADAGLAAAVADLARPLAGRGIRS
jgi:signal transduction histidine kinase